MQEIKVHVCWFKRSEYSKFEKGIMIGEGENIVDLNGHIVSNIYDAQSLFDEGCFVVKKESNE